MNRPVVVLDENLLGVLSVKITKHKVRKEDPYDTPIIYWSEASLRFASTARVSKRNLSNKKESHRVTPPAQSETYASINIYNNILY